MRIVFFGSGSFAVPSLQAILESDWELVGVVSQPPRPAGRRRKLTPTPVACVAGEAGAELIETADVNAAAVDAVSRMRPDVICVVDFGQMIRRQVRELAAADTFNLHASLLPQLRGAAPINWAIIRGFERTGITTFSLVDEMDAGPIYLQEAIDINPADTAESLRATLAQVGSGAVIETLRLIEAGETEPRQQDHSQATFAPRLKKSDGVIRWDAPAEAIGNLIHGTWLWPGGQSVFRSAGGKTVEVIIASAVAENVECTGEAGVLDGDLAVGTGCGRLRIKQIKPAGKQLMDWRDFVNGYRATEGDRFEAPDAG